MNEGAQRMSESNVKRPVMPPGYKTMRDEYSVALWSCFKNGRDKEELPEKELFIALINDLQDQLYGHKIYGA